MNGNCQSIAVRKSIYSDTCYTGWNINGFQRFTAIKSTIPDTYYTVRNINGRQR